MQPYFFPYIGYFALIKHTDFFVVFDTPQFIRHGWIERNRILKPQDGWQYLKVPLEKHKRETNIKDIKINNSVLWKDKIFAQLTYYKRKAKYYNEVIRLLKDIFSIDTDSIIELDTYSLTKICEYLNITFKYSLFSEMDLNIGVIKEPDEWALKISKALDAEEYVNLPGGEDFFNRDKYEGQGIKLKFLKMDLKEYDQKQSYFEPSLSIIDVLMFNEPRKINEMMDEYKFT